ncbi:hypothetical protein HMPREF1861_02201 [Corynebacterium kroppenstedtii]|nr:hypothetical protein HMPREF1861_02201 [Corynebacterium kroppenstedtii]
MTTPSTPPAHTQSASKRGRSNLGLHADRQYFCRTTLIPRKTHIEIGGAVTACW